MKQDSKKDRNRRYGKYDISIIKNIAGGKAYPKKNPNLISDTLLLYLIKKLEFQSALDLLWGDFHNDNLIKFLFEKLLIEVLYGDNKRLEEMYNNVLIDYVPYAEYRSYWQMFISCEIEVPKLPYSQYIMPAYFYQIKEDNIFEKYEDIQKDAIDFLYYKHESQIKELFVTFLHEEGESLYKLDKKLTMLVSRLTVMLNTLLPNENSLGLRVRNIIISDYNKFGTLIAKDLVGDKRMTLEDSVMKLLVESSLTYIMQLKRVQVVELEVIRGI